MSNHGPGSGRALVVFPGALGDLVCLLPALRELQARHGESPLVFCKGDLVPLLRAARIADAEAIEGRRVSWLFSAQPPAEAEAFFAAFGSIDSFSGSRVPEVERNLRRWQGERGRLHAFRPSGSLHLATHFLRAIAPTARAPEVASPALSLPEDVATESLRGFTNEGRRVLVIHPGSGGRDKRWSRAGFAEILRRHADRGFQVVVVLGPAEDEEAREWQRPWNRVARGLDVVALAALLARADRYLGNDSGVSHLAGAVGARGAALFGPTDPELWRPLSPRITSLRLVPWHGSESAAPLSTIDAVDDALAAADSP